MTVYLVMLCLCVLASCVFYAMAQSNRMTKSCATKMGLVSYTLLLSFVEGFRYYSVGTDTRSYVEMFLNSDKFDQEIGFEVLCKAVQFFSNSPTFFLTVCALIINGGIAIACYRMSEKPCISMLLWAFLYFYFASFNAMRQYLAIAIMVNGYYYARQKKWINYVICLAIAISFHQSALIGIVYVLIAVVDNGKRNHSFVVIAIVALASCIPSLWEGIEGFVVRYLPKYGVYFVRQADYITSGGGIRQAVINLAICCSFLFTVEKGTEGRYKYDAILILAVVLSFLQMWILMFDRFLWYFDVFSIFAIPDVTRQSNRRISEDSKTIYLAVVLLAACAFMLYYLDSGVHRVTPYRWMLQ